MGPRGISIEPCLAPADLLHVLIVGHESRVTGAVTRLIAAEAMRCSTALGPEQGWRALQTLNVDVVVVCGPSHREALVLAERLLMHPEGTTIVLLAPSRTLKDLVEALRLGVVEYLAEPLMGDELADAIRRASNAGLSNRCAPQCT